MAELKLLESTFEVRHEDARAQITATTDGRVDVMLWSPGLTVYTTIQSTGMAKALSDAPSWVLAAAERARAMVALAPRITVERLAVAIEATDTLDSLSESYAGRAQDIFDALYGGGE